VSSPIRKIEKLCVFCGSSTGALPVSAVTNTALAPVPKVGVGVLLLDASGRVLLTLRKFPPEAGCWSIVGGKLDFLESLEACAVREAREEVGLTITVARLLCVTNHLLPDENQHWVSPAFLGRILSGEPRNCEPHKTAEVSWFPLRELPRNLTITARNAIRAYTHQASAKDA
jgi:8-oxo-dGTP diphosphatase